MDWFKGPAGEQSKTHTSCSHLIQRLPRHVDAVDLQDLVVDPQQPRALCQATAH